MYATGTGVLRSCRTAVEVNQELFLKYTFHLSHRGGDTVLKLWCLWFYTYYLVSSSWQCEYWHLPERKSSDVTQPGEREAEKWSFLSCIWLFIRFRALRRIQLGLCFSRPIKLPGQLGTLVGLGVATGKCKAWFSLENVARSSRKARSWGFLMIWMILRK